MEDDQPGIDDLEEFDESRLDAGLVVAFGSPGAPLHEGLSVLAELENRLGSETRISLRGESDAAPVDVVTLGPGSARYELLGEIARGGMGVIVRTRDNDLGRDVAMKVLQSRHADNRAIVQRFVEEAQIAGQLQHPGILQVYELGLRPDKRPYFTMKLIKGRTLAELLADRGTPRDDRRRFLGIFERICQTMAYTHARGVVHRDLKPANVMVGNFGEVQIVDWGLAKLLSQPDESPPAPTAAAARETEIRIPHAPGSQSIVGSVMGTPAYMPPEQARGAVDELDERADVFALGAILCEILTGRAAYTGEAADMIEAAKDGDLDDAWSRLDACGAGEELVSLAKRCLEPRRRQRLPDAGVVARELSAYLASVEERARASELAAAEAKAKAVEERRARWLTVGLAASIVGTIVIVVGSLVWSKNEQLQRMAAASQETNEKLNEAMTLLAKAKDEPVSDEGSWIALRAAGAHVAALHGATELDRETRDRASAFLDEFTQADRDRRVIERIEDLVIVGATHEDKESWITMEVDLRQAFEDYGVDLLVMPQDEIAARIRASDLAPQLADALELWIATCGTLAYHGVSGYTREQLLDWADVLYEADPDPYRTEIRRQVYSGQPDLEALRPLAASEEFESALPRTLAWLANCFLLAGDLEAVDDVFRRALLLYPADFMLNFDYAYHLDLMDQLEEAIRYYHRALALRPKNAGMWRRLGVALRKTGDLDGSIHALSQSIGYQPGYAPTYVDLGLTRADADDPDGALDAYRAAIDQHPDLALAHCHLGRTLQALGRLAEALEALQRGHALGVQDPTWDQPSAAWVEECRRLLAADRGGRGTSGG